MLLFYVRGDWCVTKLIVLLGSKIGGTTMSDGFAGGSTGDEIIELQDIRLSPIPSIRNRHNSARSVSLFTLINTKTRYSV